MSSIKVSEYDPSTGEFTGVRIECATMEVLVSQYRPGFNYMEGHWNPDLYRVDPVTLNLIEPTEQDIQNYNNRPSLDYKWNRQTKTWEKAYSIDDYKFQKVVKIKTEGLRRIKARLGALNSFDDVELVRQIFLSIAPAAIQLTADLKYVQDVYNAGKIAISAVRSASTESEVDAVVVNWPT
jgi:hypothetical protein